jgi:hypothetical protein
MVYTVTLGPYIPCLGGYDTLANLLANSNPANHQLGSVAFAADYGYVWTDQTQWRPLGVGGTAAKQFVTSGATSTVGSGVQNVYLNGAATTHTITFPVPIGDGQELFINATQAISVALTLTVTAPGTVIKNAPATMAAGVGIGFQYNLSDTTWYRIF